MSRGHATSRDRTTGELERYSPLPRGVRVPLHPPLPRPRRRAAQAANPHRFLADVFDTTVDRVILTSSGTVALRLALRSARRSPEDEVIVPTFACPDVVQAVIDEGMDPVLCDVGPDLCLSPSTVEAALTPRTVSVVAVRAFGVVPEIGRLCADRDLTLIDDAAQSLPENSAAGDLTILSFGFQKPVPLGRGGALILRRGEMNSGQQPDEAPAVGISEAMRGAAVRLLRRHWSRGPSRLGLAPALRTHVPDAIEAIDYTRQVSGMDAVTRTMLGNAFTDPSLASSCAGTASRQLLEALEGARSCRPIAEAFETLRHGYLPLLCDSRVSVAKQLARRGIEISWLYYPLHRTIKYGAYGRGRHLDAGDRAWRHLLLVPCRPWLAPRAQDRLLTAFRKL